MIPYIFQPALTLGLVSVHGFGVLVAVALILGMVLVNRRARSEGLDPDVAFQLVTRVIVGGFVGAHLVDRFIYFPADTLAHPWSIVLLWEGLSSFGGFLGGTIGALLLLRRAATTQRWRYLDAVAYALPFSWVFGRLGCFLAFDHPGIATSLFLGERYTDGIVRHNLGLEEALYTIPVAALFYVLGRRKRSPGFFTGLLAVVYAPIRFLLDFLRIIDVRYLGLTPGQYGAATLLVTGIVIIWRAWRAPRRGSPGVRRDGDPAASSPNGT